VKQGCQAATDRRLDRPGIECPDDFQSNEISSFVLNDVGDNVNGLNLHVSEEAARRARHGSRIFEASPQRFHARPLTIPAVF
jgi:hypothetical protein